jgi:hypothetical protein
MVRLKQIVIEKVRNSKFQTNLMHACKLVVNKQLFSMCSFPIVNEHIVSMPVARSEDKPRRCMRRLQFLLAVLKQVKE